MKQIVFALALFAASAGASHAATTATPVAPKPPSAPAPRTSPERTAPDAVIEHAIQQKFAKSKINTEHFTVSVHNGVAVIEGKTQVIQHKGVATRLAKAGGAAAVQNRIQVSEEAKAKAAARLTKNTSGGTLAKATVLPAAGVKNKPPE